MRGKCGISSVWEASVAYVSALFFAIAEARGELLDLQRESGNADADLTAITRDLMARLEDDIRDVPEQYFWMHRRWKRSGVHG